MKKNPICRISILIMLFLIFFLLGNIIVFSQDAQSYYKTGYEFFVQNNFQMAEEYYKNAIELNPDFEKAHYWLGKVYTQINEYDKAVQEWKEVLRINKQNQYAFWNLINSYRSTSSVQSNNAIDYFNEGIRLIENPQAFLLKEDSPSVDILLRSIPYFKKSIEIEPELIEAYYWIAETYRVLGAKLTPQFFDMAVESYEKTIDTEEARNTVSFNHPSDYWYAYTRLSDLYSELRLDSKREEIWNRFEEIRKLPYQQALQDKGYSDYGYPSEIEVEIEDGKYIEYWIYPEKNVTFIFKNGEIEEKEEAKIPPIIEEEKIETEVEKSSAED